MIYKDNVNFIQILYSNIVLEDSLNVIIHMLHGHSKSFVTLESNVLIDNETSDHCLLGASWIKIFKKLFYKRQDKPVQQFGSKIYASNSSKN